MNGIRFCACTEAQLANAALATWPDPHLPWAILDLVPGISEGELKTAIEWAFSRAHGWQGVCGLKPVYEETARNARLLITARRIDGPMGILAECELPMGQRQVRMWLDVSERWSTETSPAQRAILLPIVIRHEGGHAVGLGHAPENSANWMAPAYDPRVVTAGKWERQQSQQRYGISTPDEPAPRPAPSPAPTPGGNMNRDDLRIVLQRYLRAAQFVAGLTGTQVDDKIVAFVQEALAQDWILDLLLLLLNRAGQPLTVESVASAMQQVKMA